MARRSLAGTAALRNAPILRRVEGIAPRDEIAFTLDGRACTTMIVPGMHVRTGARR